MGTSSPELSTTFKALEYVELDCGDSPDSASITANSFLPNSSDFNEPDESKFELTNLGSPVAPIISKLFPACPYDQLAVDEP